MLSSLPDVLGAPRSGDPPQDIEGLITIEGGHLDRHHVFDGREALPEIESEETPTHRRLQIEANDRHLSRHRLTMSDEFVIRCLAQSGETQQHGIIAALACQRRL